jgi:hypothetical protein
MLEYISRVLKEAQDHVTRRRHEDNEDMTSALRKVRRRVDAVREELERLPQNEPEKQREGKRKAPRVRVEEEEVEEHEEGQNEGNEEEKQREAGDEEEEKEEEGNVVVVQKEK